MITGVKNKSLINIAKNKKVCLRVTLCVSELSLFSAMFFYEFSEYCSFPVPYTTLNLQNLYIT